MNPLMPIERSWPIERVLFEGDTGGTATVSGYSRIPSEVTGQRFRLVATARLPILTATFTAPPFLQTWRLLQTWRFVIQAQAWGPMGT